MADGNTAPAPRHPRAARATMDGRDVEILRGKTLHYNAAIEDRYAKQLIALVKQMTAQTERELVKLYQADHAKAYFKARDAGDDMAAMDETFAAQAKIATNTLKKKFEALFASKANEMAAGMVSDTNTATKSAVNSSLRDVAEGLTLKGSPIAKDLAQIMAASVTENVGLIKSIPSQYHDAIQGAVMRSVSSGNGMADLVPTLERLNRGQIQRARLIASDQTKKVYTNTAAARMKSVGVKKYQWQHSAGDRDPRELHLQLSGQVFSLDDPPIIQYAKGSLPEVRGKPGDLINCTCKMIPVVTFNGEE